MECGQTGIRSPVESDAQGYIHSVETAGAVDGPGLRYVVFVTGCPLSCQYCHNPDSRHMKDGKPASARELVEDIALYRDFLTNTGGGVTVSGGEPLCQPAFVRSIFEGCKALGLHTALDTSGYLGKDADDALLAATDLVLLDIKSFDPARYRHVTGVELEPTLDFARRLAAMGKPLWIRCVLVPGLTDDLPTFERLADFLTTLPTVQRVEILPFHKMGEAKWASMALPYALKDTQPPSPELTAAVRAIFTARGLTTG